MNSKYKQYKDPIFLFIRYTIENKSSSEIGEECGVNRNTILNWLEKFGIPRRNHTAKNINSYGLLHKWARKNIPKPEFCEICGAYEPKDCANKDHSYKRNIDNWFWLCISCHRNYDKYINKKPGGRRKE